MLFKNYASTSTALILKFLYVAFIIFNRKMGKKARIKS